MIYAFIYIAIVLMLTSAEGMLFCSNVLKDMLPSRQLNFICEIISNELFISNFADVNIKRLHTLCSHLEREIRSSRDDIFSDRFSTFIQEYKLIGTIGLGTLATTYSTVSILSFFIFSASLLN